MPKGLRGKTSGGKFQNATRYACTQRTCLADRCSLFEFGRGGREKSLPCGDEQRRRLVQAGLRDRGHGSEAVGSDWVNSWAKI
jgi:hypothetical protein